jgi:hypothetical protein
MARALALPITGDAELEHQLLTIVEGHDKQARIARDSEPEWFVVRALLSRAHIRGPGAAVLWTCKDVANLVRFLAESAGESFNPTPRKVGDILRSLGLDTQRLGCHGRGLRRSPELRDRIHQIANQLGICEGDVGRPEFEVGYITCEYCVRYGLDFDSTGKKLRYEPFDMGPGIEPW